MSLHAKISKQASHTRSYHCPI